MKHANSSHKYCSVCKKLSSFLHLRKRAAWGDWPWARSWALKAEKAKWLVPTFLEALNKPSSQWSQWELQVLCNFENQAINLISEISQQILGVRWKFFSQAIRLYSLEYVLHCLSSLLCVDNLRDFVVLLCVSIRTLMMTTEYHAVTSFWDKVSRCCYERPSKEKIICWNEHMPAHFTYLNVVKGSLMPNEDSF